MAKAKKKKQRPITALGQARLAKYIYQYVYSESESFEEHDLGADLAYLLGAILTSTRSRLVVCELAESRLLVEKLRDGYKPNHAVWEHITILQSEQDDSSTDEELDDA